MLDVADAPCFEQLNGLTVGTDGLSIAAAPKAVCKEGDKVPASEFRWKVQQALLGVGGRCGGCKGSQLCLQITSRDALGPHPKVGGKHCRQRFQCFCFRLSDAPIRQQDDW